MMLFAVLAAARAGWAQPEPKHEELVQQRISELREKFARRLPNMRDWRKIDEEATVEALLAIIAEERRQAPRGALYHSALEELGHYPDNRSAVKTLVENIDTGVSPAPRLTVSELEGYTAAETLVKCGPRARRHILEALTRSQPERNLYLLAYVLVELDQDQGRFDVELTVARLTRQIEWYEQLQPPAEAGGESTAVKNLRRVIAVIRDPEFKSLLASTPPKKDPVKP
jgi:hypothetical protein